MNTARARPALAAGAGVTTLLEGVIEQGVWNAARDCVWVLAGSLLLKVPLTPLSVSAFAAAQPDTGSRGYSVGGKVCLLGWPA